jgi:hypothetical protein
MERREGWGVAMVERLVVLLLGFESASSGREGAGWSGI